MSVSRPLLLICVLFALVPASAQALTVTGTGSPRYQRWADRALVPTPAGQVTLVGERCPDESIDERYAVSCWISSERTIYLDPYHGRYEFLHELGHVFDELLGQHAHRELKRIWGYEGAPWPTPKRIVIGGPPLNEWFAEAYARCAYYGPRARLRVTTVYDYNPTVAEQLQVCALIRRRGAALGLRLPTAPAAPEL